ncbi:hypothetical protein [Streptomyces sp. NPDC059883]
MPAGFDGADERLDVSFELCPFGLLCLAEFLELHDLLTRAHFDVARLAPL